ncbi:FG-GAP repeat protein [Synechocystis sp. PCC 7339]|uniref:Calx-beta domain-containing protein n=1 Tax=Synechocystis sp. PCC 7339 TaxID=2782213 RepID=UPI001CC0B16A|nr:Calx-beta domain-containing protein [Synechocystis sp. PCC 7339]UAJ74007.1 FG-GAP repeat protein [Synechocystis sp. PCC 7339]
MATSTQTPAIATDANGFTHLVWNQNNVIYHAYYDPSARRWRESAPIADSVSAKELRITTGVQSKGQDAASSVEGIFISWIEGDGNNADIQGASGILNSLGQYNWGEKFKLTDDAVNDENMRLQTTADGNLLLITEKIDLNNPQADKDLYSQVIDLRNWEILHTTLTQVKPLNPSSFIAPNAPLTLELVAPDGGDIQVPGTFLVTKTNSKKIDLPVSFFNGSLTFSNALAFGGGINFTDLIGSDTRGISAFLQLQDELSGALTFGKNKVSLKGRLQGKLSLDFLFDGSGNTFSASDSLRLRGEYERNLLPGKTTFEFFGADAEALLGLFFSLSFTLKQKWSTDFDFTPQALVTGDSSLANAQAETIDSNYRFSLVRPDGTPAQPGDDPSQLNWLIDTEQAETDFLAPPFSLEAPSPQQSETLALIPGVENSGFLGFGVGLSGKLKLAAFNVTLLEFNSKLDIQSNFEVFPNPGFDSLQELLTLGLTLFGKNWSDTFTVEQDFDNPSLVAENRLVGFDPDNLFVGIDPNFIQGSTAIHPGNPLVGDSISSDVTNDLSPSVLNAGNGNIFVTWVKDTHDDNLSQVLLASSTDGGTTWGDLLVIPNSDGMNFDPVIAETASGDILIVWNNGNPDIFNPDGTVNQSNLVESLSTSTLLFSISRDNGATWSDATPIYPSIQSPQALTLNQMGNGELLLSWVVADDDGDGTKEDTLFGSFWNGTGWSNAQEIASGDLRLLETPVSATVGGEPTIFWTEVNPAADDGVSIFYSSYNQQFAEWAPAALFSPDLSNLTTFQTVAEVIEISNSISNQTVNSAFDQPTHNGIAAESDLRLHIPHSNSTGSSQLQVAPIQVKESDGSAVVVVRRTGDVEEAVSFNYRTVDGSATAGADYLAQAGMLSFAPGEILKEISIDILNDEITERRSEKFRVLFTSDHEDAHIRLDGLRLGNGKLELVATVTMTDDEPTNLAEIDSGFILNADPLAQAGMAIAPAGDINGDGTDDFLVGAPAKNSGNGAVYVIYGDSIVGIRDQGLSLDSLDGSNGVIIQGASQSLLGTAMAAADLDGDGLNDLVLGAPQNSVQNLAGKVYILRGSDVNGGQSAIDLSTALVLESNQAGNGAGFKTAIADVTGDGVADVIVSAPAINTVYVVYGSTIKNALGNTTSLNLDNLGSGGFVLNTGTGQIGTGLGVADINGDGVSDLLLGAPQANPVDYSGSEDADSKPPAFGGQVYVAFGGTGLSGSLNLNQLNGSNGLILNGQAFYNPSNVDGGTPTDPNLQPDFTIADNAGTNVVNAGDINNDGFDDFIVSAANSAANGINGLGRAYVVFGKASGWDNAIDLQNLDGTDGFIINGIYDTTQNVGGNAGYSISAVGDINNDLFDDFIISAPTLGTNGPSSATGQSYLILGTGQWSDFLNQGVLELSDVNTLNNRVFLFNNPNSGTQLGLGLGSIGDVNGDGSPDLAIATPQLYPGVETSQIYIAYGHPWVGAGGSIDVTKLRSDNGFVFQPITGNEIGTVKLGADINNDGYIDTLIADAGFNGAGGKVAYIFFGSDPAQPSTFVDSVSITIASDDGLILGQQTLDYGDFNNDGITDFVVARSGAQGQSYATIVFGSEDSSIWSNVNPNTGIGINDLLASNGGVNITVTGVPNQGKLVNLASGDFNGDGIDDVLISSANLNPFIVFGQQAWSNGSTSNVNVLSQSLPIQIEAGKPISAINSLGDVNGDGFEDFGLVGIDFSANNLFGYVVFGKNNLASNSSINLATLNGSKGFELAPIAGSALAEQGGVGSISLAGDLNGDGFGDFIVGLTNDLNAGQTGAAYVVFGGRSLGSSGSFSLNNLNGGNGFTIQDPSSSGIVGYSVTGGGDINGDGYDDLVVSAPSAGNNQGDTKGSVYTLFGGANLGVGGSVDLSNLNGSNGFETVGAEANSFAGSFVGGLSDVNGDGFADLGIGAQGDNSQGVSGLGYNVFGGDFTQNVTYLGTVDNDIFSATQLATAAAPHIMNGGQGNDILQSAGVNVSAGGRVVMNGGQGNDLLSIGSLNFERLDGGSGKDTLQLNSFILSSNNLDLTDTTIGSRIRGIEVIDLGVNNRVTLNVETLTTLSDTTNIFTVLGHDSFIVASDFQNWIKQGTVTERDITYDQYVNEGTKLLIQQSNNLFESTAIASNTVSGTEDGETIVPGIFPGFVGKDNFVFALGGDDLVDLSLGQGNNQVYGGAGNDNLIAGQNDSLFGGLGNDILDASGDRGANNLDGGDGDDTFFLGQRDKAFGGDGNDVFFVRGSGKNLMTGGAGADQFWIADVDFGNSFNAILDFELDLDIIGLKGLASRQGDLSLIQYGPDVLIALDDEYLARVQSVFLPLLEVVSNGTDLFVQGAQASAPITVTNTNDSGAGSLRQAIIDAGNNPGADTIDLTSIGNNTIQLSSRLPSISTGNDITFQTAGVFGSPTIKAPGSAFNNIFDIAGATVSLSYMNLQGGHAQGSSGAMGGGGGVGGGGALTIRSGSTVIVDNVVFDSNRAVGGNGTAGARGGGGEFAGTPDDKPQAGGGGGLFNNNGTSSNGGAAGSVENGKSGGTGGNGTSGPSFGIGGGGAGGGGGGSGGTFGTDVSNGGNGGIGGVGGFGAGGGAGGGGGGAGPKATNDANRAGGGGSGGSGGGSGIGGNGTNGSDGEDPEVFSGSSPGGGGTGGGGSGLGGAVVVNAATVTITNSTFQNNTTQAGSGGNPGQALGGAIFITDNSAVAGDNLLFSNNSAPSSPGGSFSNVYGQFQNNNDVYGTINSYSNTAESLFNVPPLAPEPQNEIDVVVEGNLFFVQLADGSEVTLLYQNQPFVSGSFGNWQILEAETVNGINQVLWENPDTGEIGVWNADSNWNWISSETWPANSFKTLEAEITFQVDLNGDELLGDRLTNIETQGNTSFLEGIFGNYYVQTRDDLTAPIKYLGEVFENNLGDWQGLAAEMVNGINQVLWQNFGTGEIGVWNTDGDWNWLSSDVFTTGSLQALEQQSIFGLDAI